MGIGSGGWLGTGVGQGVLKNNYLPEAHTDMIFATIGEELGLLGATLIIAAYVAFAYAGLRVALRCRDPFGKRLAAGLTTLVAGQALINLAAVLGLAPLTGITLPFVSYGGSSLVVSLLRRDSSSTPFGSPGCHGSRGLPSSLRSAVRCEPHARASGSCASGSRTSSWAEAATSPVRWCTRPRGSESLRR
jgi:hypothetical protein